MNIENIRDCNWYFAQSPPIHLWLRKKNLLLILLNKGFQIVQKFKNLKLSFQEAVDRRRQRQAEAYQNKVGYILLHFTVSY